MTASNDTNVDLEIEHDNLVQSSKKKPGRRRKGEGPAFPREEVDRLLVHGELEENPDGSGVHTVYPSYRDLAERFGVAHSLIADYARQHNCLRRRERIEERVKNLIDSKLIESRAEVLAMERDEQINIINRFLMEFEKAIVAGRVRVDNPADFNTMCRLKAFLLGDADSRQQMMNGLPTLEEMQIAHKKLLETTSKSTPASRGEVPLYGARSEEEQKHDDEREEDDNPGSGPDCN